MEPNAEPVVNNRAKPRVDPAPLGDLRREPAVIVPLDGTEASMSALPVARTVAELAGATMHLVYVDPVHVPSVDTLVAQTRIPRAELKGMVLDPRMGEPAEQIVFLAREQAAAFIVLCTHGGMLAPGKGLGRTAEGVLANAPCPVLFVSPERGLAPWNFGSVLLPHDATPTSSGAVKPMVRMLRKAQAKVWVLYVAKSGPKATEAGALPVPRYVDQPQHEWPAWAGEFVERFNLVGMPDMRFAAAAGDPGEEILKAARQHDIDLIVLGWRGTLASERAGVLKRILAEAPCPVLIFRVATPFVSTA